MTDGAAFVEVAQIQSTARRIVDDRTFAPEAQSIALVRLLGYARDVVLAGLAIHAIELELLRDVPLESDAAFDFPPAPVEPKIRDLVRAGHDACPGCDRLFRVGQIERYRDPEGGER